MAIDTKNGKNTSGLSFEIPESGYKWSHEQLVEFDNFMRNDKIPKNILIKLLVELKEYRKKFGDDYPVSEALGYVFNVVIDKNLGCDKWRGYTADWKLEMRDRAIELLIKHAHGFDVAKMNESKNADPYYYLGKIVYCAFCQAKDKLLKRKNRIKTVSLNEAVMTNFSSMDEFVISANHEIDEQERIEKEAEEEKKKLQKKFGKKKIKKDDTNDVAQLDSMSDEELCNAFGGKDYIGD